jgi:hypothetical protein
MDVAFRNRGLARWSLSFAKPAATIGKSNHGSGFGFFFFAIGCFGGDQSMRENFP